jgi:hypothetical protein
MRRKAMKPGFLAPETRSSGFQNFFRPQNLLGITVVITDNAFS